MRERRRIWVATALAITVGAGAGAWLAGREGPRPRQQGPLAPVAADPTDILPGDLPASVRLRFRHLASSLDRLGCQACHLVPGLSDLAAAQGPDLSGIRGRLSAQWLRRWLRAGGDRSDPERRHDLGLSAPEAEAAAAWLWQRASPPEAVPGVPPAQAFHRGAGGTSGGDPFDHDLCWDCHVYSGRRIATTVGCLGCHAVDGEGGRVGPELTRVAEKLSYASLRAWSAGHGGMRPGRRMADLRLTPGEARVVAAWLEERNDVNYPGCSPGEIEEAGAAAAGAEPSVPGGASGAAPDPARMQALAVRKREQEQALGEWRARWEVAEERTIAAWQDGGIAARGKEVLRRARCTACHRIEGVPADPAARSPLRGRGWDDFARSHLADGAAARPVPAGAPRYRLSEGDRANLSELLSLLSKHGPPVASLTGVESRDRILFEGRRLIDRLACTACHVMEEASKALPVPMAAALRTGDPAPPCGPSLGGEGRRALREWLSAFLASPVTLRSATGAHMPAYGLTEADAAAIADFLRAVDGVPDGPDPATGILDANGREGARKLVDGRKCLRCHLPAKDRLGVKTLAAPLVSGMRDRLRPEWVEEFLAAPVGSCGAATGPSLSREERVTLACYLLSCPREILEKEGGYAPGARPAYHKR